MTKRSLDMSGMSRRQFLRYTALGSTAVFMAACAAPAAPTTGGGGAAPAAAPAAADAPAPAAAAGGPKQGGTMTLMGHQEVSGLGPDNTGPTVEWVMVINIHNPLVTVDENFEMENVLAKSVDVSDDGLTYTFQLHEGVKFHDGTEFTAEDVAYTYDFYRNPDNGASIAGEFTGVGSVEAPDKYTVVVNMETVNAGSLTGWAGTSIVQSKYHAEVGEEKYRTAPIGTGPYKLKEWRPAEFTELVAFDDHFRGRPNIDVLRQDVVPEPSVRMIALQSGEADSAVWPLLVEDSVFLESDPGFVVYRTLANSIKHFPLNLRVPALSDKMVRKARCTRWIASALSTTSGTARPRSAIPIWFRPAPITTRTCPNTNSIRPRPTRCWTRRAGQSARMARERRMGGNSPSPAPLLPATRPGGLLPS